MYDLNKIDERFHEFFDPRFDKYVEGIEITDELFKRAERFYVPFGEMSCRLIVEDGKPVLRVRIISRMDTDIVCFIGEDTVECYNLFDKISGEVKEISECRRKR